MDKPTSKESSNLKSSRFNRDQLASTVKTLQFAWFIGHLFTLIGVFFFTLTYFKIGKKFYKFWFQLATIGIIQSFGILIFQLVKKLGFNISILKKDDNVHFFGLGLMFLILRPYIIFPILPFQLFSLFHVLNYSKGVLLPIFGQDDKSTAFKSIDKFVSQNNGKSIQLAGLLEIFALLFLFLRVLLFRKRSLTPFLIYLVFIKLRYEKSAVTRNHFKSIEIKIDGHVNDSGNVKVKEIWLKIKDVIRKVGGITLVNDYSKNKVQ